MIGLKKITKIHQNSLKSRNFLVLNSKTNILFPKYREKYIKETWKIILRVIYPFGITSRINFNNGMIEVKTTNKLNDPYLFIKGRDFFKLLSRGIPIQQAAKIFNEDVFCEIIKISKFTANKKKFLKRRRRLIGNKGITIRAIEYLTQCYILIQGNTVACMGSNKGIKEIRKIIIDSMKSVHPIFHIKNLIVKEKLFKDPLMKKKSWDEYLPIFYNKNTKIIKKEILFKKKNVIRLIGDKKKNSLESRCIHEILNFLPSKKKNFFFNIINKYEII
jgi:ribosomal RNA assembly protein